MPITNDFTIAQLMRQANDIYDRQHHAFRLNLQFGLILVNTQDREYRYFRPYSNDELFERPIYISRRRDLNRLRLRLQKLNVTDYILQQRPNSKWKPILITNVRFCLFHLNYSLGQVKGQLPAHIESCKAIVCLNKDRKGVPYKDKLCAFRCLAVHLGYQNHSLESEAKSLYKRWAHFINNKYPHRCIQDDPRRFNGLHLNEMLYFEQCFEININIFQLKENGNCLSIYKSHCQYSETMYLNMYHNHLSYISNFPSYAKKYQCHTCHRHFALINNMKRHQRQCQGRTKHQFPGGYYGAKKSIFDKLDEQGIKVSLHDRLFPYFVVYDFEAMLVPVQEVQCEKLTWTHRHDPVSVSVCSNVESFDKPRCFINPNVDELVGQMVGYMREIAHNCFGVMKEKLSKTFAEIDKLIRMPIKPLSVSDLDDEELLAEVENMREILKNLKEELEAYCRQIICLGFNSSKYDINLIKSRLFKHLNMDGSKRAFTVKRNNQYVCLSTEEFKFLDITQYLAPGINYANFLKAFDVPESKGFFPYEWFDDISKLNYPRLPNHQCFYSSLKGCNITEEEYAYCEIIWRQNDMSNFRDFLIWYSNLDTAPFVKAVENLQKYYFERTIDIFKVSISVPGIARQMLFDAGREAGASFALYDDNNKDLYYTIKDNIVGGPSVIYKRYSEVGKTHTQQYR
ncbi:hypothetical protein KUTeg_014619 [Tegillarca granosa]|uniref:C2H2-type domain-containing protein n=1 Tax=Tegillarca granosa TaxID=220873 RepID=A0ABQ9ERI6_TEGGR|nr:hypothetical protein KUTeg_014619 [Tegillarca granosa]